jgi:hypothetical protein
MKSQRCQCHPIEGLLPSHLLWMEDKAAATDEHKRADFFANRVDAQTSRMFIDITDRSFRWRSSVY